MYESLKSSKFIAIILMMLGIFLFFYDLIQNRSFSVTGVVSFLSGLGLLNLTQSARIEIDHLRVEMIEVRKMAEKRES